MNKKIILIFTILISFGSLYALSPNNGLSTGGLVTMETHNSGGSGEIGFSLVEKGDFTIRNHILISGFGYDGGGVIALGDKLIIGGFTENNMRPYTFIKGHVGLYKTEGKNFLEMPLYIDAKGGGIDIYATNQMSFFVEVGGGISFYGEEFTGAAHLSAGFRTFWN